MNINAFTEFGMDLSDEELTRQFAGMLPDCTDGHLEINFSRCIIDYPATSIILDAALEKLERTQQPRHLVVLFNIKFHERSFLKWLFFGSPLLGLDQGTANDEQIQSRVIKGLKERGILFSIDIIDSETQIKTNAFTYGK